MNPSNIPMFPPPEEGTWDEHKSVAVMGAAVSRVRFGPKTAVFSAIVLENDVPIGFRFELPKHKKLVREFLRAGSIREAPPEGYINVPDGMSLVKFEGWVIGADSVPANLPEGMPTALYVTKITDAMRVMPVGLPIPEA